jgi:hypothetical protein
MLAELENVKVEGVSDSEEILKTRIRFGTKGLTIHAQSKKLEEFFKAQAIDPNPSECYLDKNYTNHFKAHRISRMFINGDRNVSLDPSQNFTWLVNGEKLNYNFLLAEGLENGICVTVSSPLAKVDFDRWVKGLKETVKSLCRNYLQEYEVDLVIYEKEGRR